MLRGGKPGLPSISALDSEISELEGKKSEMANAKSEIIKNVEELQSKKGELENALSELNSILAGPNLPPEARPQITERISYLQNALQSIEQQITFLKEKHTFVENAVENIRSGIQMRKSILHQIAGRQAANFRSAQNRELGSIKG